MKVAKNKHVTINYTLKDDDGNILDSSNDNGPLSYIQGLGMIIPGLESDIEGKQQGDKFQSKVAAKDGYGEKQDHLILKVPKKDFESQGEVKLGMNFQVATQAGVAIVTVVKIENEEITIDANHPMAGKNLNFDVSIEEVRDATQEELDSANHSCGDCCGCN